MIITTRQDSILNERFTPMHKPCGSPKSSTRIVSLLICVTALVTSGMFPRLCHSAPQTGRPNIVIILVDDMGYSDIGSYGGEIDTPNLDRLADNGLRYTSFYNTGRCWPTRSSLLTGYYAPAIAMDPPRRGESGPPWVRTIPQYLREAGYRSYHSGKWHYQIKRRIQEFSSLVQINREGRDREESTSRSGCP